MDEKNHETQNYNIPQSSEQAPVTPMIKQQPDQSSAKQCPSASKSNKILPIVIAVLAVLLCASVSYNIYTLVSSEECASECPTTDAGQITQGDDSEKDNSTEETIASCSEGGTSSSISSEYIYLPEWGVKIKKPENLGSISYSVTGNTLFITGIKTGTDLFSYHYAPSFANITENTSGLGALTTAADPAGVEVYNDGGVVLYYVQPQAVYTDSQDEQKIETATTNLIQDMLKNNITKL